MTEFSLTALANRYGTDKGTNGPSASWFGHNYTDIYEAYLWPRRYEPIRLLEVGLGVKGDAWLSAICHGRNRHGGASVKMWTDYFPDAHIFGIDINPAGYLDSDRVTTFLADQRNEGALRQIAEDAGPFDVIVDDGSHRAGDQQITFGVLFDYLKPGGLYFIEDLMTNGINDPRMGRFSSEADAACTRDVFRMMAEYGKFGVPNVIGDCERHADEVDWVHLHSPAMGTAWVNRRGRRRMSLRFRHGSEQLVVLRRRDAEPEPPEEPGRWWRPRRRQAA